MTRVKQLLSNNDHEAAEGSIFMQRLCHKYDDKGDLPTKIDVLRYSYQLKYLFDALEARMKSIKEVAERTPGLFALLSRFCESPWDTSAEILAEDIRAMEGLLSPEEQTQLRAYQSGMLNATTDFCATIADATPVALFAFYSVRCLGDAFGGQAILDYQQQTFNTQESVSRLYARAFGQRYTLCAHVNKAVLVDLEEEQFAKSATAMFTYHKQVFEQLEASRGTPPKQQQASSNKIVHPNPSLSAVSALPSLRASITFFATAATVAAVAVAYEWQRHQNSG